MYFSSREDKKTRYLLNIDFDENDEVVPRFVPVMEHHQPKEPLLVPADVLGAVSELVQSMWDKLGTLNFNDGLALLERETHRVCRRLAASRFMSRIRKRPAYRFVSISRGSRTPRPRAPRRSRRSVAVASTSGGDDGGGGDSDQPDPPRPRLTPVLGIVVLSLFYPHNSKTPWRRRRPGPCRVVHHLLPVPRGHHGCLGPP